MRRNTPYFPYDDETDELPLDDGMDAIVHTERTTMDEEEARSYSSVYDLPFTSMHKKYKPKQ